MRPNRDGDDNGGPSPTRLMLSVAEASAILGVSDDLVYELAARGELLCVGFGRRRMIPRRAIDLLVDEAVRDFDAASTLDSMGVDPSTPDGRLPASIEKPPLGPSMER